MKIGRLEIKWHKPEKKQTAVDRKLIALRVDYDRLNNYVVECLNDIDKLHIRTAELKNAIEAMTLVLEKLTK